jgi:SpoVK/Ycf46/Vps4 family AAA+-type ATPase
LIKYHAESNEQAFRDKAYEMARYFDKIGDSQLGEYIMALMSDTNVFVPQMSGHNLTYLRKIHQTNTSLPLPEAIANDVMGTINAVNKKVGIHKVLLEGAPGTGKTETAYNIARILERDLFSVDFSSIVDSKLGQTSKNMTVMFDELRTLPHPDKIIILFDEIDAIALDRINSNDLREMGRVTSTLIKELDLLNDSIVLIATTNLFTNLDKALVRRFDSVINFGRYSKADLVDVSVYTLNQILPKFETANRDVKLFKKILSSVDTLPSPGELKNMIKISLAFSDPNDPIDYLRRLYIKLHDEKSIKDVHALNQQGFTVREIEALSGLSKTQVSRKLSDNND